MLEGGNYLTHSSGGSIEMACMEGWNRVDFLRGAMSCISLGYPSLFDPIANTTVSVCLSGPKQ